MPHPPVEGMRGGGTAPHQSAELFDRLLADTIDAPDAEIEQAWKTETRRRIDEIENGTEPGVPREQAMAELRRIVGR